MMWPFPATAAPAASPVTSGERADHHRALVQDLAGLTGAYVQDVAALGIDRVSADLSSLQRQATKVSMDLDRLQESKRLRTFRFEHERDRLHRDLAAAADPAIAAFIAWCQAERDRLPSQLRYEEVRGRRDVQTGHKPIGQWNNSQALGIVIEAIQRAMAAADALRLQTVPDVVAALETLRASIPTVAQAEEQVRADG